MVGWRRQFEVVVDHVELLMTEQVQVIRFFCSLLGVILLKKCSRWCWFIFQITQRCHIFCVNLLFMNYCSVCISGSLGIRLDCIFFG